MAVSKASACQRSVATRTSARRHRVETTVPTSRLITFTVENAETSAKPARNVNLDPASRCVHLESRSNALIPRSMVCLLAQTSRTTARTVENVVSSASPPRNVKTESVHPRPPKRPSAPATSPMPAQILLRRTPSYVPTSRRTTRTAVCAAKRVQAVSPVSEVSASLNRQRLPAQLHRLHVVRNAVQRPRLAIKILLLASRRSRRRSASMDKSTAA